MPIFGGDPRLDEIADGVHVFLQPNGGWCLSNAGLLAIESRPVLIDTAATEARAVLLRSLSAKVTADPPGMIINTHSHGDHTFGNFVFPEALVVGHERTRLEVKAAGLHLTRLWPEVTWGSVEIVPPQVTFPERLTIQLGDHYLEARSFGPAHSGRDTIVWLPRQRVLFAGDLLMSGVTPFVLTGSVLGLRSAVAELRRFDAVTVVPGHGPVGGRELLDITERYLDWLLSLAREAIAADLTPVQAAREADLGEFAGLLDSERLVPNLYRACRELRGAEPGTLAEVDMMFAAMVEFHGRIPECHA
jgi:cyclase